MTRLERAYRRLLILYPRSFRRAYADDIVATLMDAAPPERVRPTPREAAHLLLSGLVWRFRLPGGWPARSCALAVTLFAGLLAAGVVANQSGPGDSPPLPLWFAVGVIAGLWLSAWALRRFQRDMHLGPRIAMLIAGLPSVLGALFVDVSVAAHAVRLVSDGQWSGGDTVSAARAALYSPWLSGLSDSVSAITVMLMMLTLLITGSAAVKDKRPARR